MRTRGRVSSGIGAATTSALVVGALVCACSRSSSPRDTPVDAAKVSVVDASLVEASVDAASTDARDATDVHESESEAPRVPPAFLTAKPLTAHPIGHTSVVLKVKLEGGLVAAWKPNSRRGRDRYRGEIAAVRLARALGIPNVPPAELRAFTMTELSAACDDEGRTLVRDEALADAKGTVPGALVPWIAGLSFPPLESEPARSRWQKVLAGEGTTEPEGASYFGDLSTLVAFDTISGNWDRWSGGNVGRIAVEGRDGGPPEHPGQLLFVDNDAAFLAHPPPDALARNTKLLSKTKRFSRAFATRLRAFDPTTLESVLGVDLAGKPLLDPAAVSGVRARIGEVLRALAAAMAEGTSGFP